MIMNRLHCGRKWTLAGLHLSSECDEDPFLKVRFAFVCLRGKRITCPEARKRGLQAGGDIDTQATF